MRGFFSFAILLLISAGGLQADNWPQWRGPSDTGVGGPGDFPVAFSDKVNVAWKVALPAPAPATPAVWGDHIFVTSPIDGKDGILCFDLEGNERWRVVFGPQAKGKHRTASGSNPSPLTDGTSVFVYYKSGTIAALDFEGHVIWKDNLQEKHGQNRLKWDLGTSPVLSAGRVVVAVMQHGDSYLVALDAMTGKVMWKEMRDLPAPDESADSYTTPSVISVDGHQRIIVWGADHVTGHAAGTGQTLWACDGFNPRQRGNWRSISSASVWKHVAVISYGRGGNLCAIDLRDGVKSSQRWLWNRDDLGSDVPTPVTHDGRAYVLEDNGTLVCLDIKTGKDLWSSKAAKGNGRYYASPIIGGANLYGVSDKGVVVVGQPANGWATTTTNRLNETVISTPVPVNSRLLIRGAKHLFCLGP
jgi:outer membrane protein assembly factor BamB